MLNKVILMGRLTRDPEIKTTQSGKMVTTFTLAVDRDYVSGSAGERKTDFIDIEAWRGSAEFVEKYFSKGQPMIVSGRLKMDRWTDTDGNKRRSWKVVSENIYFAESKKSSNYAPPEDYALMDEDDSDLPF